jgi:hypothetical protein
MTRLLRIPVLCLLLISFATLGPVGCGGPGEKDKNKDKDVPKPAGKPNP